MTYGIEFINDGMPSRNCPECGEAALEYYDTNIEGATSGVVDLYWECSHCGVMGRDEFSLNLDGRAVDTATLDDAEAGDVGVFEYVWEKDR